MTELNILLKMQARPPPVATIAKAFSDFFAARVKNVVPVEGIQAQHALLAFNFLKKNNNEEEHFGLSMDDLQRALMALTRLPSGDGHKAQNQLAKSLFTEIKERRQSLTKPGETDDILNSASFACFIDVLCQTADSLEARNLVEQHWHRYSEQVNSQDVHLTVSSDEGEGGIAPRLWHKILKGFAKEEDDEELLRTVEIMQKHGAPFDADAHQSLTSYFVQKGDMEATKMWYTYPIASGQPPLEQTVMDVLNLCMRQKELEWGDPILKSLLGGHLSKTSWNIILKWAYATSKGVDEIERMMKVMVRRMEEAHRKCRPDIETINGMVELANHYNDPYTAERLIALGHKWQFPPNARTFLLQLEYRLKVGDVPGARVACGQLQTYEVPMDQDVPLINKLIVSMCVSKVLDHDAIMSLVEGLNERKIRLEPETVSALCSVHLRREDSQDLIDLLQSHTFNYSLEQRATIRDVLVEFCLDRANSTSRAWVTYQILRRIFSETEVAIRTRLMNEFFTRMRCDMACHVFGHMRQSQLREHRPNLMTYVSCFEGIAKAADIESLEMVHNMLKLDSEIDPNTKLHNALMLAYTACDMPYRSLEFWDDIVYSREGPTYNSIRIALRACEAAPFGDRQARVIWDKLKKFEIDATKEIYAAYVGALAGQGLLEESAKLIDHMKLDIGSQPDVLTIGTFYNAIPGRNKKDQVEEWARHVYPSVWEELQKCGKTYKSGGRGALFNIDRDVPA